MLFLLKIYLIVTSEYIDVVLSKFLARNIISLLNIDLFSDFNSD